MRNLSMSNFNQRGAASGTGIRAGMRLRIARVPASLGLFAINLTTMLTFVALLSGSIAYAQPRPQEKPPNSPDVPVVKGDSGSCTVDFVVHDGSGKGIYNAMITLHVEW